MRVGGGDDDDDDGDDATVRLFSCYSWW